MTEDDLYNKLDINILICRNCKSENIGNFYEYKNEQNDEFLVFNCGNCWGKNMRFKSQEIEDAYHDYLKFRTEITKEDNKNIFWRTLNFIKWIVRND